MESKEDQTAPVSKAVIQNAISSGATQSQSLKDEVVRTIIGAFNEKRDSYNGIVSSVIDVFDTQDAELVQSLIDGLCKYITANPMVFGGKMFVTKAMTRLVKERPNFVMDLFEQIIETTDSWSGNFAENSQVLKIQIISIKAIRQAEQSLGCRPTQIPAERMRKLSIDAIHQCDDRTKIDTLSLILASRSTSKPLEQEELELFKVIFQDALSLQEPALRQIFLSQTNKLMIRIVDSIRVVTREVQKRSDEERKAIHSRYNQFLKWLVTHCFDSIYCNAYFGSFILTISSLKLIIQHITFENSDLPVKTLFEDRRCYDSLLSCLTDSFEENKSMALDLLLSLPYNDEFINNTRIACFERIAYQLVTSVNPAHSLTCLYVFRLVIGLQLRQKESKKSKNQLLLDHLSKLTDIVEENVKETRENFILALKSKSIHPKLTCIRALLDDIDIIDLEKDRNKWATLAKRIVSISIDACQAVSSIVCNLNPETIGHLPMDLNSVDVETLAKTLKISLKISDTQKSKISSQMLLISGWKTIKECSLSLGAMCVRFWWPNERIKHKQEKFPGLSTKPILEPDDIIKIIDFFNHYLRNLRHRGAFEQAYNGFIMVTRRIWHDDNFRARLVDILHTILADFRNEALDSGKAECLKAYVTRRSAGLPFIVQAILNSEHKHDSRALRSVMNCLFEVLDSKNAEEYQRIHCLNILRALVKEHFLGEKMLTYVGKTFEIAMSSFKSDSFPVRNCANMLLKAAVDRTFGINRLRHDIHRKNQLSYEKFFTECPNLHALMLTHLNDGLLDKKYLAAVHSVFIVLFRLRPSLSPSEKYSNDKMIRPFIQPVTDLAMRCPDSKLRELAAKLAVRLEIFCEQNGSCSDERTLSKLEQLIFDEPTSNNKLHGALLLTKAWVDCDCLSSERQKKYQEFAQRAVTSILQSESCPCFMKDTALEIIEICSFKDGSIRRWKSCLVDLYLKFINPVMQSTKCKEPFYEATLFKSTCLLLVKIFSEETCHEDPLEVGYGGLNCQTLYSIIRREPNREISLDTQASLIRFLRQSLSGPNDFIDNVLLDKLDTDFTAAHLTLFDKLQSMVENNPEQDRYFDFRKKFPHNLIQIMDLESMFDLTQFQEFKLDDGEMNFTTRQSNSPRAVELLIFAYKLWDQLHLSSKMNLHGASGLHFFTKFISCLPDCDVRSLAIVCAGKLAFHEVHKIDEYSEDGIFEPLARFSELLDDLSDGDHSLTTRIACTEVLRENLKITTIKRGRKSLQGHLTNLISSLVKLSQDEEYEVRLLSQHVILSLNDIDNPSLIELPHQETRLGRLIRLIGSLFDPSSDIDVNSCFELLMRIIFNHSRNYSNDLDEEKERLFDKTKLNTFADHVSTIKSALGSLQTFFGKCSTKKKLNSLKFSPEIIKELRNKHLALGDMTGDYSWRIKRDLANTSGTMDDGDDVTHGDNNQIVDEFIVSILEYLDYFASGYVNVLADTDYTPKELALYKKVAFLKFVIDCTEFELKNFHLIAEIGSKLDEITRQSCSTTILCKIAQLFAPK